MKMLLKKSFAGRMAALLLAILLPLGAFGCENVGEGGTTDDETPHTVHTTDAESSSDTVPTESSLTTVPSKTTYPTATVPTATVPSAAPDATQTTASATATDATASQTVRPPTGCRYEHTYGSVPCTARVVTCTLCGHEADPGPYSMLRVHQYADGVCTECREREEHAGLQFILDRYHIGDERFYSVVGLGSYDSPHLTLPETYCGLPVKKIYHGAFQNSELESVEIPKNVEVIGEAAFSNAKKLSRVVICEGVQTIQPRAFEDCTSLAEITLPSTVVDMGAYVFWRCTSLTSVTCREGMTELGAGAFAGCTALAELTLADSIVYIEDGAFQNCISLKSVTLPASYGTKKQDGVGVFEGCTSLTDVIFQEGCLAVSTRMFKGCVRLSSVSLPQSLGEIYSEAFEGCESLTAVTYRGTRAEWMNVSIRSKYLNCDIVCQDGTLTAEMIEASIARNLKLSD